MRRSPAHAARGAAPLLEVFSHRFVELMRAAEYGSDQGLADALGVDRRSVERWRTEKGTPDATQLLGIARHFGVTVDWLLGVRGAVRNRRDVHADSLADRLGVAVVDALNAARDRGEFDTELGRVEGEWVANGRAILKDTLRREIADARAELANDLRWMEATALTSQLGTLAAPFARQAKAGELAPDVAALVAGIEAVRDRIVHIDYRRTERARQARTQRRKAWIQESTLTPARRKAKRKRGSR